jgi:hypothetical protein
LHFTSFRSPWKPLLVCFSGFFSKPQLELEKQFAQQRAEQSELEKQLAEQRAESLAQRLRELGIEP